jgi:hypothetical protein
MNSVSVQGDVVDVETNAAHVLVAQHSLLGCPLEPCDDGVLDFVKVLNTLRDVNNDVRASSLGSKAPDLTSLSRIVFVLFGQDTGAVLSFIAGIDFTLLDIVSQSVGHW